MSYIKQYCRTLISNTFVLGIVGLGLALSLWSGRAVYNFYGVDYSVVVPATVLSTQKHVTTNSGGRLNIGYSIEYAYEYGGRAYQSTRYRYSHSTPSTVLELRPGDVIDALIDPNNPGDSVIVYELTITNWVGLVLGLILIVFGLVIHGKTMPFDDEPQRLNRMLCDIPEELKVAVASALGSKPDRSAITESTSLLTRNLCVDVHTAKKLVRLIAKARNIDL